MSIPGSSEGSAAKMAERFAKLDAESFQELRRLDPKYSEKCGLMAIGASGTGKTTLLSSIFPNGSDEWRRVQQQLQGAKFGEATQHCPKRDRYCVGEGMEFIDTPGYEPGKPFDAYRAMLTAAVTGYGGEKKGADCVWFCYQALDPRVGLDGVHDVFKVLQSLSTPVIIVFTKSDDLESREDSYKRRGGTCDQRRKLEAFVQEQMREYSVVKGGVFVNCWQEPADVKGRADLVKLSMEYLAEGAKVAFVRAQVADVSSKIRASAGAIVKRIGSMAAVGIVPWGGLADVPAYYWVLFKPICKIWGIDPLSNCGGEMAKFVLKQVGGQAAKDGAVHVVLSLAGLDFVSSLIDPGHNVRQHVERGLSFTAILMRLHQITGGAYADLKTANFETYKKKVERAVKEYEQKWEHTVVGFSETTKAMRALPGKRQKKLESELEEVLVSMYASG